MCVADRILFLAGLAGILACACKAKQEFVFDGQVYRLAQSRTEIALFSKEVYVPADESDEEFAGLIAVFSWKPERLRCLEDILNPLAYDMRSVALNDPVIYDQKDEHMGGGIMVEMLIEGDEGPEYYLHKCYVDKVGRVKSIVLIKTYKQTDLPGTRNNFREKVRSQSPRWVAAMASTDR